MRLPRRGSRPFIFPKFDKDCQSLHCEVINISLTLELENAVKAKVESGLYNNASEVVRVLHSAMDFKRHLLPDA